MGVAVLSGRQSRLSRTLTPTTMAAACELIGPGQQAADNQDVIRESSALRNFALERDRPQQRMLPETSTVVIALALALLTGCSGDEGQSTNPLVPTSVSDQEQTAVIPSNLTLPLLLNEINLRGDINPFGS